MKYRSSWRCVCGQYSGAIAHRVCTACEFSSNAFGDPIVPLNRIESDQKTVAERQWQQGKLAPVAQKPCDHGLFSDEAKQTDLIDHINRAYRRGS